jgi:SulP family sulfate permease
MDTRAEKVASRSNPTFAELFTPKLITVLREGYGLADLRARVGTVHQPHGGNRGR